MPAYASGDVEIENSPGKLLGLCALGVLATAASAAVAVPLLPGFRPSAFEQTIGYVGTIFFGFCLVVMVWRLLTGRGPVVTITSLGIRDTRLAAEFIPWTAVRQISTWQYSRQQAMVLAIDPAVEKQLTLTAMARWSRGANRALGADGLCVTAAGLKIDYPTLLAMSESRFRAAQGRRRI